MMGVDITKITDTVLEKMGTLKTWPWDIWWKRIARQKLPANGSKKANYLYVHDRLELKNKINYELAKRRLPNRLFVEPKFGLYMVDEKKVTAKTIKERQVKMTACMGRSIDKYHVLSKAKRMSKKNVALLENRARILDENKVGLFIKPNRLELISDGRDLIKEIEILDEVAWVLKNAHLTERERDIYIKYRCDGLTLEQIGQEEKLTRARIGQILEKVQKKFEKVFHKIN